MKKTWAIGLALALAMFVAGCGPMDKGQGDAPALPVETPAEPDLNPAEPEPEATEPQPEEAEAIRPGRIDLPMQVECSEESMAMVLWQTERFSVYVPASGWSKDAELVWRPDNNPAVSFFVRVYANADPDQAAALLQAEEPGYDLADEGGGIRRGKDAGGEMILRAKLVAEGSDCFAVCSRYPLEAAEGYGARLFAITDTFEVSD